MTTAGARTAFASFGLAALSAWAFGTIGRPYGSFHQPAAGITFIPPQELAFDLWFLVFGGVFVVSLATALHHLGWATAVQRVERGLLTQRMPVLLAIASTALAALVRHNLMENQVITDDEETYLFIARTLLEGRVVNPLPDEPDFFINQFVVIGPTGWYGKYPIGHPLVLAGALAVGLVNWVTPLLCGLTTWLTWAWGRGVVGPRRAAWATLLLTLSPHFVWTHATLLSQTTTSCALMAGCLALATWRRSGRWAALLGAGLAFGFTFLARPMPGATLALVGAAEVAVAARDTRRSMLPALVLFGLPVALAGAAQAAINLAQAGTPFSSGYQQAHGSLGVIGNNAGTHTLSLVGAMVRENFWLFGWPVSLLPVAAARPARGRVLLWGMVASAVAYRLLVPKTAVSTTGPTYMLEAVPALTLLAADGLARARAAWPRARVETLLMAMMASAWVFFVPVEAASVQNGIDVRRAVYQLLEEVDAPRALVFTNQLAGTARGLTWAYYPPNPSPRLDDDLLFVRMAPPEKMAAFAQRYAADRPAFVFSDDPFPTLLPLQKYLKQALRRRPTP